MRCPDCNKFVGLDFSDPELESIDVTESTVTATVRIVRTCCDCGTELKEASLELEAEFDGPDPDRCSKENHDKLLAAEKDDKAPAHACTADSGHELEVEDTSIDQIEEGGGRYAKSYFGATVSFTVKCTCGCGFECEGTMSDKVAASGMDEMA